MVVVRGRFTGEVWCQMRVERRGVKFEEKTVPTRFVKEGDKALQKAGFTAAYTVGYRLVLPLSCFDLHEQADLIDLSIVNSIILLQEGYMYEVLTFKSICQSSNVWFSAVSTLN